MAIYNDISGILLADKPGQITSFKTVHKIKKILNVKKTGHCGTLDPAATGLLIVLVGKATKLQDKFMKQDKVYRSSFLLGTITDSGDLDGKVLELKDASLVTEEGVKKALKKFEGEIFQIPPMFSALKINGKKLCDLARKGIEVERAPRKITIKKIELLSFKDNIADVRVECSSGTYIRTLAEDVGKILGCGATVAKLRREKIGNFNVADAVLPQDLDNKEILEAKLIQTVF
ncbi:tRNA pseudouridine(55) synthase TruB [Endomicrobium proavitum]|uniref:tRNA pseudouridine synthase B n=1 Tax=Endomicrobium proavitum TaxID=1408281 RepID=A0A0G3WJV5_9BACT|nr:tRNA pseudouridine(55) synthase TruB [Endomicrobium proavitum]AKL98170.1 tRNA pseudouridine synthase B [Endomicrobium proavitum]